MALFVDEFKKLTDSMNSVVVSVANLEKRIGKVEFSQNLMEAEKPTPENQLIRLLKDLAKRTLVINFDIIFDINVFLV